MRATVPRAPFNRWDLLAPASARGEVTATVVIAHFERPTSLARVLAALGPQLADGDEVIVVDDGSRPGHDEVAAPEGMPVRVIRRPDEGFRLAAARDDGARAAQGDVLLFLDDDMIPEPGWLDAHMRWHAAHDGLLTIGGRRHVDVEGASGGDGGETVPRHVADYLAWTGDLTAPTDDLFRICSGGNLGMRWSTYDRIGGFDRSASRYGGEDIELGHRAVQRGCVLVPVTGAECRHLGPPGFENPAKAADNRAQRAWMADRIPHPSFRSTTPGRSYRLPSVRVVVQLEGVPAATVEEVAESALASTLSDLDVHVVADPDGPIGERLGGDRRIAVGPPGEGPLPGWAPDVPVHVLVRSAVRLGRADVATTVRALAAGRAGVVHLGVDDPPAVTAVLTRAAARESWAGASDEAEVLRRVEAVWGARRLPVADDRAGVLRPSGAGVEDDLATIRYALRRLPAPAVRVVARSLRWGVSVRARLARRMGGRPAR